MTEPSHYRLFAAIPVPEQAARKLRGKLPNFPLPGNLHLTLRFIGHVTEIAPFIQALATVRHAPLQLEMSEIFYLHKTILVAGLLPTPQLELLKTKIDAALQTAGLESEERKFQPHITLSRRGHKIRPMSLHISWFADNFRLYKSTLLPCGALHEEVARFALNG